MTWIYGVLIGCVGWAGWAVSMYRLQKKHEAEIKYLDEFWWKSYVELFDKFRAERDRRMAMEDGEGWKREQNSQ